MIKQRVVLFSCGLLAFSGLLADGSDAAGASGSQANAIDAYTATLSKQLAKIPDQITAKQAQLDKLKKQVADAQAAAASATGDAAKQLSAQADVLKVQQDLATESLASLNDKKELLAAEKAQQDGLTDVMSQMTAVLQGAADAEADNAMDDALAAAAGAAPDAGGSSS